MSSGRSRRSRAHLTGRAAILAVVVCAIVLTLAVPLREYLAQRQRMSSLNAENQHLRQHIAAMKRRERRLDDPDYIKRLARERLHYAMPGERNYIIIDGPEGGKGRNEGVRGDESQQPWFVNLWESVDKADGGSVQK